MGSSSQHRDDFYRAENLQHIFHAHFSTVFKRIIPPDNRVWLSEGIRVDVAERIDYMKYEARITYNPRADVVPQQAVALSMLVEHEWADQFVRGQSDFIFENEITDFVIKLLMVYSRAEKKDGTNS